MANALFLDSKSAIERIGGDDEIYKELLKTYLDTYGDEALKKELKTVVANASVDVLKNDDLRGLATKEFHKIKGASLTIGADKLGQASKRFELYLKNYEIIDNIDSVQIYDKMLDEFMLCYKQSMQEIQGYLENIF